jgi:acyl-CoA thioesterase-1
MHLGLLRAAVMTLTFLRRPVLAAVGLLVCLCGRAAAEPVKIVAIGASNTKGFWVGQEQAYPARLQALLRSRGIEAHVTNAGVHFDTTTGMLRRIDSAVPDGTHLVIVQPGGNDLRFFGTRERRSVNIATMERRLRARGIKVVLFDPVFPPEYYTFDGIHFTAAAHAHIAARLEADVLNALGKGGR